MKNRLLNQLTRAYNKRVTSLNKNFFKNPNTGMLLLVEQLKYIRDVTILKPVITNTEAPTAKGASVSALTVAIEEFETYQKTADPEQKVFHWNNFCEFVRLNMEEWLVLNDSV